MSKATLILEIGNQHKDLIKKIISNASSENSAKEKVKASIKDSKQNNQWSGGKRPYNADKESGPKDKNSIMGKSINQDTVDISTIRDESGYVAIKGDIFSVEIKETKTGRIIMMFNITDYTSSITVKCFPKPKDIENCNGRN